MRFSKRPLLPVILSLILGILLKIPHPFPTLIISFSILTLLFLTKKRGTLLFLYTSIILSGSLLIELHQYVAPDHIKQSVGRRGDLVGTVWQYPAFYPERTYVVLKAESFEREKVSGLIQISLPAVDIDFSERIRLKDVKIKEPADFRNPGVYSRKDALFRKRIYVTAYLDDREKIERLGRGDANLLSLFAWQIRCRVDKTIKSIFSDPVAGFLSGIILGDRAGVSNELKDVFRETGTIHILAVSGLHLGILAGFFLLLGKVFGINPRISYLLTAILIFLFVPVTGARTPIIRAFIMTSAVLFSKVIDRDSCSYNSLSLAAVILLVMNPHQIFDIGFQLSFSACISILYFSNRFRPKQSERFAFGLLASAFRFIGVCVAAYLGTAPVILFYFGKVAAFGILSNVVVIPLVALILPFGFFLVGIGSISLTLANALGVGLSFLVEALFWLTSILPKPIFHLPNLTPLSVALLYSGMVVLVKIREIGAFKVAIGALVLINIFLYRSLFTPPTLEITFLDVGYGESIFIRFPYNGNMLIDGGSYWTGKWVVLPYLRYRGVERLDIVVATHSDSDHIGGLIPVLSQIKAEKVLFSQSTREEKMFLRFLSVAKESGAEIHKVMAGDRIDGFFGVEIEILNPGVRFLEDNNNSVVMRLRFSDFSILFTGDVEKKAQMQIVQKSVSSTVLKAPHHGLKSGYWQGFFEKVKPEIVVVAGGPADIEKGVYPNALYTREAGAITLLSSGRGYRVKMRN